MGNVYVVFDNDNFIIGIYRTLESAKKCALEEIENYCNKYLCDESEKLGYISELNDEYQVDEIVYISSKILYD